MILPEGNGCFKLFIEAHAVYSIGVPEEFLTAMAAVSDALGKGLHAVCWLSYELGHLLENTGCALPDGEPLAWFGIFDSPELLMRDELSVFLEGEGGGYAITQPVFTPDKKQYTADIRSIKELIESGEVYQVNYTGRFDFGFSGCPLTLFRELLQEQQVDYAAYIDTGERQILSLSPELFFSIKNRKITSRPMKGTAARGRSLEEDGAISRSLAESEKNCAENLMIVDLVRNDLGRIALPGSIRVLELFRVEAYTTLFQMTSTVEAILREGLTSLDILKAIFPCGSITGTPRIRAMQVIDTLEVRPRGVYTGALGYFAPGGDALFNVAIRTVEIIGNSGRLGAGGGIVADSDAEEEYEECRLKGSFLNRLAGKQDFYLIETLLMDNRLLRLDRHLRRLAGSAHYLGFRCDLRNIRSELESSVEDLPPGERFRVRLALRRDGGVTLTRDRLEKSDGQTLRVGISTAPVPSSDPFLRHKTSWRPWFKAPLEAAGAAGYADVLLVNEQGQLTQGCISNVFIERSGMLYTPPLECGLLPGVLRSELLEESGCCVSALLYPEDLLTADAVYLGSALRGLRKVAVLF